MTTYRAKIAHNVALVSLTTLNPQPASAGVQFTREDVMGDGTIVRQGLYVELVYDTWPESIADYQTQLAVFGLVAATSADVTIYARDDLYNWKRYNGRALRPPASWNQFFPRQVVIVVRDLEVLA